MLLKPSLSEVGVVERIASFYTPLVASGTSMFLTTKQGVSERISSIRQQSAAKIRSNVLLTWMLRNDALQHRLGEFSRMGGGRTTCHLVRHL